jgi:hypothetical protein
MADNNAGTSGYEIQAKPGEYRGHQYDSKLEIRTAKLLDTSSVVYAPHQTFHIYWRNGDSHEYTVDFLFYTPQKLVGIHNPIHFLEVKGTVRKHDINRIDALEYCYDCNGYIAETQIIKMWERDGLKPDHEKVWHHPDSTIHWFNQKTD